ncbi:MAG: hypothetical protein QNK05_12450 [Myxococcota bacterium]|nr:hypothetical protein [Myxococcota bacterium]
MLDRSMPTVIRPGAAALAFGLVCLLAFASACSRDEAPGSDAAPVVAVPPPSPTDPDVEGLPPLVAPGVEREESELAIGDYFDRYGGVDALEPNEDVLRADLAQEIEAELVGKQITWDGYVARIQDAPSGRVMLVLTRDREQSAEAAMVRLSAAWSEYVHAVPIGTRVRVVGVFDKTIGVFPSIAGISLETLPATPAG